MKDTISAYALRLPRMTADVLVPTSAAEAASLFGDGEGLTVFGGGTILLPEITAGRISPTRALLLHRAGLDSVSVDGDRVTIGAATPVSALADLPDGPLAGSPSTSPTSRSARSPPSAAISALLPAATRSAATSARP